MRSFRQVDVFGSRPCLGNPLGVVHDASGLADEVMATFSRWTNLSEVTFLLPPTLPGADYRVRIFTGRRELPFAGHPTLGSAHAFLEAGGEPRSPGVVVQECGVGLVDVRVTDDGLAFSAPPLTQSGPLSGPDLAAACAFVGVDVAAVVAHAWGVNGPRWAMLRLADDAAVRAVRPTGPAALGFEVGVVGLAAAASGFAYEVRGFLAEPTVMEDPVTGSLNAAVAQWLRGEGLVPPRYVAVQGSQVGAAGEIQVSDEGGELWIGGRVHTVVSGAVSL